MKKHTNEPQVHARTEQTDNTETLTHSGNSQPGTTDEFELDEDEQANGNLMLRHQNRKSQKKSNAAPQKKLEARKPGAGDALESRLVAEELPQVLNKELFAELAAVRGRTCISLFMATQNGGEDATGAANKTIYKKQLQEISSSLQTQGFEEDYILEILQPARDLLLKDTLWNMKGGGLALFISDDYCKYIQMPVLPLEERMINSEFLITPLVQLMETNEYFYLLVISKKSAKLFKGDEWGLQIVPVELPQNTDETKSKQATEDVSARRAKKRAGNTGIERMETQPPASGVSLVDKSDILGYFEAVDDALWEQVLNKENAPLLLAAVEYEIPIYKDACDYHNVWPAALTGNRDQQETSLLFQDAKELIQPYFDKKLVRALENYANNSATLLTSSIPQEVIPASHYAQVSHLFVCRGARIWGNFDEMNNELKVLIDHEEGSENLVNTAVVKTISNGGAVFVLDREQMPDRSDLAAILRF